MRDVSKVARDENTPPLGASCWLDDPLLRRVVLHVLLEVDKLVGQDVGFGDEAKVLGSVDLPQFRDLPVHKILSRHVERAGEVIDFLIFVQ